MIHEDFLCSIGELIDKLIGEDIKCYHFNNLVDIGIAKAEQDVEQLTEWEEQTRRANEQRSRLRDAINERIAKAVSTGKMDCAKTVRTYRKGN